MNENEEDSFGRRRPGPPMIGIQQIGLEGAISDEDIQWRTAQMIARALNTRRVVGFLGSGISKAYGFKGWKAFADSAVKRAIDMLSGVKGAERPLMLLQNYDRADNQVSMADRTLTFLGTADEAIRDTLGPKLHHDFREAMADIFREAPSKSVLDRPPSLGNPVAAIIEKLEIRRFLTTNYDKCIENAFERAGHLPGTTRVRPVARFLAFDRDGPEALLQFAVGAPRYEMGVFHIHGVASDSRSMIVTEGDYQRLYLRDDTQHRAYREALRIAFSANPILFMGVGLTEADLLRPLRQFVSERAGTRPERPLFALYERPNNKAKAEEWRRYLYSRFGLKVLYYKSRGPADQEMAEALLAAVNDLAGRWLNWWSSWQDKPSARTAVFRKPVPGNDRIMVRHQTPIDDLLSTHRDDDKLSTSLTQNRVVLALGRPGSGKGTIGLRRVMDNADRGFGDDKHKKPGRFFATAHFTNDLLSMIQAAADHLSGNGDGDPLFRLKDALKKKRHLFVLGGIERLLVPITDLTKSATSDMQAGGVATYQPRYPVPLGKPVSVEVEEFLKAMVEVALEEGKGRVILTSSVWPVTFDATQVQRVDLEGVVPDEWKSNSEFKDLGHDLVERLCTALGRHAYALSVVTKALEQFKSKDEKRNRVEQLISRVTAMDLPRRTERAIEFGLNALIGSASPADDLDRKSVGRWAEYLEGVLERVALFSTPVPETAVVFSYQDAFGSGESLKAEEKEVLKAIRDLERANLLLRVEGDSVRYTAHTVVRSYVLQLLGCLPDSPGEAQRFMVGGFATEETEAEPGSQPGYDLISSSIDNLLSNIEKRQRSRFAVDRQVIRAAFGLIRSRWTATGIARLGGLLEGGAEHSSLPPYDHYRQRLARLLNVIRRARDKTGQEWSAKLSTTETGILYIDELLWLYNELALSAFCQGSMRDAYPLFRMVQDIVAGAEPHRHGERWCQSEINLGLVQLERGWLRRARYHLENAIRVGDGLPQGEVRNQAIGYLGLVSHLSGEYARAKRLYEDAIERLDKEPNGRALSIFHRHRGDLLRKLGESKGAEAAVQASVAAAESGRYPDLQHYARLAQANIRLKENNLAAVTMVSGAAEFARKVGLPKLEADAYITHARFALAQGDIDLAGRRTSEALAIASALGMGLRLTGALVLAAKVASVRGYPEQARQILTSAIRLSSRQGHQLRVEAAEQELMGLPRVN